MVSLWLFPCPRPARQCAVVAQVVATGRNHVLLAEAVLAVAALVVVVLAVAVLAVAALVVLGRGAGALLSVGRGNFGGAVRNGFVIQTVYSKYKLSKPLSEIASPSPPPTATAP